MLTPAFDVSSRFYVYGHDLVRLAGLEPFGVDVLTICPGFIETPMTEELQGSIPMLTPQKAAAKMVDAIVARSRGTVFVPERICISAAIYTLLPMQFRALLCRLVNMFTKHDFLKSPN